MALLPCPECRRHVRASESACPFCGCGLALESPREIEAPGQLSRSAQLAWWALVLAVGSNVAVGCRSTAPVYGGPPPAADAGDAARD